MARHYLLYLLHVHCTWALGEVSFGDGILRGSRMFQSQFHPVDDLLLWDAL